jgi:hypothetical protein
MDELALNNMLYEMLLEQLGDGLDSVADRLIHLHDRWDRVGNDPADVEVLRTVLVELGWWSGQIDGALDHPSGRP